MTFSAKLLFDQVSSAVSQKYSCIVFSLGEGKCIFLPLKGGELKRGLVDGFEHHLLEAGELIGHCQGVAQCDSGLQIQYLLLETALDSKPFLTYSVKEGSLSQNSV